MRSHAHAGCSGWLRALRGHPKLKLVGQVPPCRSAAYAYKAKCRDQFRLHIHLKDRMDGHQLIDCPFICRSLLMAFTACPLSLAPVAYKIKVKTAMSAHRRVMRSEVRGVSRWSVLCCGPHRRFCRCRLSWLPSLAEVPHLHLAPVQQAQAQQGADSTQVKCSSSMAGCRSTGLHDEMRI